MLLHRVVSFSSKVTRKSDEFSCYQRDFFCAKNLKFQHNIISLFILITLVVSASLWIVTWSRHFANVEICKKMANKSETCKSKL